MKSKYNAKKTTVYGIVFDSKKEAIRLMFTRLKENCSLKNMGTIINLERFRG